MSASPYTALPCDCATAPAGWLAARRRARSPRSADVWEFWQVHVAVDMTPFAGRP